jgi:hypothetical protein
MAITIDSLHEDERKRFFDRVIYPWMHGCETRRNEFRDRFAIATDTYDKQVAERIKDTHKTGEVIEEMTRWSVGYYNTWKRLARKLAVAYKRKPRRRLEKRKTDTTKLTNIYRKVGFDAKALEWQRLSIIMNRIIVLVVERKDDEGNRVTDFELATGWECEAYSEPGKVSASVPDILAQKLATSWSPREDEPALRTIDSEAFRYWNSQGKELTALRRDHRMGMFPGADMLSAHAPHGDYFDWRPWRSITRATIDSCLIGASMNWTRKTQCRKLIAALTNGDADEIPDGQSLAHHEKPLMLNGPNIQLLVSDLNTGVDGFLAHIKSIQDEVAEQMTGTASTFVDPDPALPNAGVGGAAQHEAISEVRESQISNLERFEQRMAILLAKMETLIGGPDALDPELVRDKFRIAWPRLAFQDSPEARIRVWTEQTAFGISDQVDALVELEGISEEEAEERLMTIAERRAKLDGFRASRNQQADPLADPTTLPLGAAPGESLAQTQGRMGGSVDADGNPTAPEQAANGSPLTEAPPTDPNGKPLEAPAAAAAGVDVQALALNGAQIASLQEMAMAVAEGKLPAEFVVRLIPIALPTLDESVARRLMEPLESFKAKEDPPPVPFGGAPPQAASDA